MMNEFEKGLVFNFSKLGCVGLSEKLADIFSNTHVREDELLSVLTNATSEEIMRIKQAKAERLLRRQSSITHMQTLICLSTSRDATSTRHL